jgi:hypothetical protein
MAADRESNFDVHVFACAECPQVRSAFASGWKAYRIDDPEFDETPQSGSTVLAAPAASSGEA